jgi:hypothetical protein
MYILAVTENDKQTLIDNRSGLYYFDNELNYSKMVVPEVLHSSYFLCDNYEILSNGDIIGTSSNFEYKKNANDSIITVARYDSTGKFLGNIGYLPEQYTANNLNYDEHWKPLITTIQDEIFISYPRTNGIYSTNQKLRFNLTNLPFSNDSGFVLLHNYYRLLRLQNQRPNSKDIGKLMPFSIINTFNTNNNFSVILLVFDETEDLGFYYIAQEYDKTGNLLSHTKIYDEPENQIRHFAYDKYNNYLCVIRKNKEGWTLEKREWK